MQYLWLLVFVLAVARLLLLFWETSGWLALQWWMWACCHPLPA